MAVLAHDHFDDALVRRVWLVELFPVEEDDHISGLLDLAAVPQVAQLAALVRSLLALTRHLRQCDNDTIQLLRQHLQPLCDVTDTVGRLVAVATDKRQVIDDDQPELVAAMQGTRPCYDLVDVQAPVSSTLIGSAASLHMASLISPDFVLALPSRISDSGTFEYAASARIASCSAGISPLKNALAYPRRPATVVACCPNTDFPTLGRAATMIRLPWLAAAHDALKVCVRHQALKGASRVGSVDRSAAVASASAKGRNPVVVPRSASSAMRACASAIAHQRRCQP